jgi:peptide/nickel transport system ATP-binding protein
MGGVNGTAARGVDSAPMIEVENLDVHFGSGSTEVHAVKSIGFRVAAKESFGLVGESGSGKSTVLRAICGLARPSGGTIRIGGEPVREPRDRAFARRVQMVFQDPYGSLHPRHTIDRVLSEPLAIHGFDDREQRVARALKDVGLGPSFRFRMPHQLSGGQRQRVAIARALIVEPEVLLLDEPTSALDASVQAEILNLLSRLRAERNLTYLLVSHNLAVVDHMCERLLVMKNGEALESFRSEALAGRNVETDYTRALLEASEGYVRDAEAASGAFGRAEESG